MIHFRTVTAFVAPLLLATASHAAIAQTQSRSAPEATALPPPVPAARDIAYPGTIALDIDATDITRAVYKVTETIPVPKGSRELILQLPEWLPGNHSASGTINLIGDIHFEVDGKEVAWRRDPVEVYAFHVPLPDGAKRVTARFVHTSPLTSSEGRVTMTREMLNLQWEKMSLYPAGYYVRQIEVTPTVTFPDDWKVYTALDGQKAAGGRGNRVTWATTPYDTLVDSPIFAGQYAQSWDLGHAIKLDVVGDQARLLAITPEHLATFRNLADEAVALFGKRHFDHYDLLLALTDRMGGIGLEHHRSSENQYQPKDFVDWDGMAWDRNVVAHELTHSWNGKYRRPEDLWTPDYRQPMRDSLLWMYEGQTQLWGWVLAARSGVQSKETILGALAGAAAYYSQEPGRAWRSVQDTTNDPIVNDRANRPYDSLHRDEDYYTEGALTWLEADQIIREGTSGQKGLDDFAKLFFGGREGDYGEITYDFNAIVAALNQIYPYDWASFLDTRLRTPGQPAPVRGIEKAGYHLVWKDTPNPYRAGQMKDRKFLDLLYSLGVSLDDDGVVTDTMWDSPAFNAGLVDGAQVIAVDGDAYSDEVMKDAITDAKADGKQIDLLIKRGEQYLPVSIAYKGGLRYPWLEKSGEGEQGLDRLLAPHAGGTARAG